ncbi:hypothetical protein [Glutamicibacter halophytocola]|uniref:hypothetical protein n=1 Tax=Glutamicibacter halophytocola TaxID=1933880 RepID=UPI001A9C6832|nr:hypothetical protein [Glutamicibacter halophytocola]
MEKIPKPDMALAQHLMPVEAGKIGTSTGPILSAGDNLHITVCGHGSHGSMPHNSVDPMVLDSSIVLMPQTIVSRETRPGQFAILTVRALNAGSAASMMPGECQAAGLLQEPDF